MEERRSASRCEVCSGPTKYVGEQLFCRNSLCSFNHQDKVCPRCESKGPEAKAFVEGQFSYTCLDCLNNWQG